MQYNRGITWGREDTLKQPSGPWAVSSHDPSRSKSVQSDEEDFWLEDFDVISNLQASTEHTARATDAIAADAPDSPSQSSRDWLVSSGAAASSISEKTLFSTGTIAHEGTILGI